MIYKIRVILNTKEDVFRDIEIKADQTLYQLHIGIKSAFSLLGEELASFYESDNDWTQGKEIPLEDMSDDMSDDIMSDFLVSQILPEIGSKILYVYDFINLWSFYVEVLAIENKKSTLNYPLTVFRYGKMPLKPTIKGFNNQLITLDDFSEVDVEELDFDVELEDFDDNVDDIETEF